MKTLNAAFLGAILFMCVSHVTYAQNLPVVNKDGSFHLFQDKFEDTPTIFGYLEPDVNSEKVICFSSMTEDVEGNPHHLPLGAYYTTEDVYIDLVDSNNDPKSKFLFFNISTEDGDKWFYLERKHVKFE